MERPHISLVELIFMIGLVGIGSWILSFIWLGWLGNGVVWFWAKVRGLKMKTHSQDFFLHFTAPLLSFIPILPTAIGQILFLYTSNKALQLIEKPKNTALAQEAENTYNKEGAQLTA